ncbi:hypothetical protein B0H19DRAFT_1080696 [Mycena capillaripes]|nr:hypothetical protein B0H19DRAFT_1080696 [Mycena capillaripes]
MPMPRYAPPSDVMVWFADNPEQERGVAIDLASFPNLSHLRITLNDPLPPTVLATLSTIAPWHRIHRIVLSFGSYDLDRTECAQLDSALSTLPVHHLPTVEFEDSFGSPRHQKAMNFFPELISRDMFCFVERYEDMVDIWWESSFMTHDVVVTDYPSNSSEVESVQEWMYVLQADWRSNPAAEDYGTRIFLPAFTILVHSNAHQALHRGTSTALDTAVQT